MACLNKNIWSLDLSTMTGVAMGRPPEPLKRVNSFTLELRLHGELTNVVEDIARCELALERWFKQALTWKDAKPDLLVYEAPMDVQWASQSGTPRSTFALLLGPCLAATTIRMCEKYGIDWKQISASTARNTFIGKSKRGKSEKPDQIKKDVLEMCKKHGYLPNQATLAQHNNQADALCLWHYSQVAFGGYQPPFEHLMGQMVPVIGGTR